MKEKELIEEFIDIIPRTMWSIRFEMRRNIPDSLSVTQARVMIQINKGVCHAAKLADLIGVSTPAMSRMIDQLEKKGFVKRVHEEKSADRRQVKIILSDEGESRISEIKLASRKQFNEKLSLLTSEEKETLRNGLKVLDRLNS